MFYMEQYFLGSVTQCCARTWRVRWLRTHFFLEILEPGVGLVLELLALVQALDHAGNVEHGAVKQHHVARRRRRILRALLAASLAALALLPYFIEQRLVSCNTLVDVILHSWRFSFLGSCCNMAVIFLSITYFTWCSANFVTYYIEQTERLLPRGLNLLLAFPHPVFWQILPTYWRQHRHRLSLQTRLLSSPLSACPSVDGSRYSPWRQLCWLIS